MKHSFYSLFPPDMSLGNAASVPGSYLVNSGAPCCWCGYAMVSFVRDLLWENCEHQAPPNAVPLIITHIFMQNDGTLGANRRRALPSAAEVRCVTSVSPVFFFAPFLLSCVPGFSATRLGLTSLCLSAHFLLGMVSVMVPFDTFGHGRFLLFRDVLSPAIILSHVGLYTMSLAMHLNHMARSHKWDGKARWLEMLVHREKKGPRQPNGCMHKGKVHKGSRLFNIWRCGPKFRVILHLLKQEQMVHANIFFVTIVRRQIASRWA
eukprot:1156598-Pelagomonas_calceolata.AAC.10